MAAIFVVSGQPSIPSAPDALLDLLIKKALHALAYAILAFLWWRAVDPRGGRARRAALVLAICALYAVSDEWHQTFVPGRSGRATDVLIDVAGAGAALAALARWPSIGRLPVRARDR